MFTPYTFIFLKILINIEIKISIKILIHINTCSFNVRYVVFNINIDT